MKVDEMNEVLEFFFTKKVTVHIDTKSGEWYNGLILEMHEKFLVIHDRVLGETPILFSNIKILEKYREKVE
ncbi:MAG TPA: hypothetical protein VMV95_01720 [Bacillota bacterium]|nr:hypothetical protein [Bacillota bacterium]